MQLFAKLALVRSTAPRIWALAAPYFRSEDRWKARGLLLAIVLLNLGTVYMAVQFNEWNRVFYDALQQKDQAVFWAQLLRFTYLAFGFIVIAVYKFYLTQLLEVRWRAWMTQNYLQRWLANKAFYRMELARFSAASGTPDNPDQRIQEDLNLFTTYTLSLSMGMLNAVVTLVSFVGILWGLSGGFTFSLGGATYQIHGYMVWAAVLYCIAGSAFHQVIQGGNHHYALLVRIEFKADITIVAPRQDLRFRIAVDTVTLFDQSNERLMLVSLAIKPPQGTLV